MKLSPVPRRERGSATVLAVAAIAVVLTMTAAALVVTATVRDAHVARGAADLAALAAAGALAVGAEPDCGAARRVAAANSATLSSCSADGAGTVVVSVTLTRSTVPGWFTGPGVVSARARAGLQRETPPTSQGSARGLSGVDSEVHG